MTDAAFTLLALLAFATACMAGAAIERLRRRRQ